jgi:hypothetical protein
MAHMVRVWRRRLLGGLGVTMIVPGMLLASLALLGAAGGFGGFTALGQAFSGPPAPTSALAGLRTGAPPHPLPATLVAALSKAPASSSVPGGAPGGPASSGSGSAAVPGPLASIGPPASGSQRAYGPIAPGAPASRSAPQPQPQPQPQPTVVDRIVGAGSSLTGQLPSPVGSTAASALKSAGAALDSIVPIKSP